MTFTITRKNRNVNGKFVEYFYEFTAASGDTTGTVVVPLKKVKDYRVTGELADYSANLASLTASLKYQFSGGTSGITIAFTNPAANAQGRLVVVGLE